MDVGRASPSLSLTSSRRSSVTLQATRRLRLLSITPITLLVVIWLVWALFGSQDTIALTGSQPELASNPSDSTYLPPGLANQPDPQIEKAAEAAKKKAAEEAAKKKATEEAAKKAAEVAAKEAAERERKAFISDFLSTDIRGAYDGQALYDLCAADNATWDQNIIFECPHLDGGYGNVRNAALQCIRLAIEARGTLFLGPDHCIASSRKTNKSFAKAPSSCPRYQNAPRRTLVTSGLAT
jgi:hypothetical protein